MRLWTLHPRYLDAQGLVALWREGLLARAVVRDETRGYRRHPQLARFVSQKGPLAAIDVYLRGVLDEAGARGYSFDRRKIGPARPHPRIKSTTGQVAYEWKHLLRKLKKRSPESYRRWRGLRAPKAHPLFRVVRGPIEDWERPS